MRSFYDLSPEKSEEVRLICSSIVDEFLTSFGSIRQVSTKLGVSKSNVHKYVHTYIKEIYPESYVFLVRLLEYNKVNRFRKRFLWGDLDEDEFFIKRKGDS